MKNLKNLEEAISHKAEDLTNLFINCKFNDMVKMLSEIDGMTAKCTIEPDFYTSVFSLDEIINALKMIREHYTVIDGKMSLYHIVEAMLELQRADLEKYFFNECLKKLDDIVK